MLLLLFFLLPYFECLLVCFAICVLPPLFAFSCKLPHLCVFCVGFDYDFWFGIALLLVYVHCILLNAKEMLITNNEHSSVVGSYFG